MCKSYLRIVPAQARELGLHIQVAEVIVYKPLVGKEEGLKIPGSFGSYTYTGKAGWVARGPPQVEESQILAAGYKHTQVWGGGDSR